MSVPSSRACAALRATGVVCAGIGALNVSIPLATAGLVLLAIVLAGQVLDRRGTKRTDLAFGD